MVRNTYNLILKKIVDNKAKLEGKLAPNGFLVINNYFNDADLKKFPLVSKSMNHNQGDAEVLLKFPFLSKILFDQNIISIVRDYLGENSFLDYVSARSFIENGDKSDYWHHDSVGHRIKIFLCINDQNETTHTQIIPNTHKISYSSFGKTRFRNDQVENINSKINVIGKKNDLLIFDTNILHRGQYSSSPREIVQFEFSDSFKSLMLGHIGPRKSKFDKTIIKSPLISVKKINFFKDYASY